MAQAFEKTFLCLSLSHQFSKKKICKFHFCLPSFYNSFSMLFLCLNFFRLTLGFRFMNISVLNHLFLFASGTVFGVSMQRVEFFLLFQEIHVNRRVHAISEAPSCIKQFLVPIKGNLISAWQSFARKSSFFLGESAKSLNRFKTYLINTERCTMSWIYKYFFPMLCHRNAFFYLFSVSLELKNPLRISSLQCTSTPTELFTPKVFPNASICFLCPDTKARMARKPIYKARNTESH